MMNQVLVERGFGGDFGGTHQGVTVLAKTRNGEPEYITLTELADKIGVSTSQVSQLNSAGRIPEAFMHEDGHWRVPNRPCITPPDPKFRKPYAKIEPYYIEPQNAEVVGRDARGRFGIFSEGSYSDTLKEFASQGTDSTSVEEEDSEGGLTPEVWNAESLETGARHQAPPVEGPSDPPAPGSDAWANLLRMTSGRGERVRRIEITGLVIEFEGEQ